MTSAPTHPAALRTRDERALLNAIWANPDSDDPRLVYSDWLEENGNAARAEFVRVQCELARAKVHPMGHADIDKDGRWFVNEKVNCKRSDCVVCQLRTSESALLREHEAEWRCPAVCERCGGKGKIPTTGLRYDTDWRKKRDPCPACHGLGRVGILNFSPLGSPITVDWARGFARISCPAEWWCEEQRSAVAVPEHRPTRLLPRSQDRIDHPNARRTWEEQGYCEVRLMDREQTVAPFAWWRDDRTNGPVRHTDIPYFIYDLIELPTHRDFEVWKVADTAEAAHAALSRSAALWARRLVMGATF